MQLYLDIEQVRFGHRLHTVVTSSEACNNMKIPAMLLQPVVENAIKFGLYDTTEEITITIEAIAEMNRLIVVIQNPFDSATSNHNKGTGFGLSAVRRRLYLVFAQQGLLQTSVHQGLFTTTIIIPQSND